jgi:uncharacterized protein (TIGR02594 family)
MIVSPPIWLGTMRDNIGMQWAPGNGSNPQIANWLQFISRNYPATANYCAAAMHEGYFPWCGLAVAYCMANAGRAPVFGRTDKDRFLRAAAWLGAGDEVTTPRPGDIVVFDFGAGDQHVTFFEKDLGNGFWTCLGGNQSHQVKRSNFHKSALMGIRCPSANVSVPALVTQDVHDAPTQRFGKCVALVLASEGGNVDDPRDRGGRTSRGVTQDDWNRWRLTRPGLPVDVFQAPQDQIVAIYHDQYWDAVKGDDLPSGVDYAVFDCGVLNGVGTAARILRQGLDVKVDGDIEEDTLAACSRADKTALINQICDDRLSRMRQMSGWPTFGKGWTKRVESVRSDALKMIDAAGAGPSPTTELPAPSGGDLSEPLRQFLEALMLSMKTKAPLELNAVSPIGRSGALVPAEIPAVTPVIAVGATGAQVTALQTMLQSAGYDVGAVDGVFGPLTRAALLAFQADNNMETTGVADAATASALAAARPRPLSPDRMTATADDLVKLGSQTVLNGNRINLAGLMATVLGGMGLANSTVVGVANAAKPDGGTAANAAPVPAALPPDVSQTISGAIQHLQAIASGKPAIPKGVSDQLGSIIAQLNGVQISDLSPLLTPDNLALLKKLEPMLDQGGTASAGAAQLVNQIISTAHAAAPAVHSAINVAAPAAHSAINTVFDLDPTLLGSTLTPIVAAVANSVLPGFGGALATLAIGLATQALAKRVVSARVDDHRTAANVNR